MSMKKQDGLLLMTDLQKKKEKAEQLLKKSQLGENITDTYDIAMQTQ